jgi:putative heme-binding domain-containing protein
LTHAEDASDHNLPLMIWYGLEPVVAGDPQRALQLASRSRIPQVARYTWRRLAADRHGLAAVIGSLRDSESSSQRDQDVLREVAASLKSRRGVAMPDAWRQVYQRLSRSDDPSLREVADQVAVALGDRRVFPRMRDRLADQHLPLERRLQALQILVEGSDPDAGGALLSVLAEPGLQRPAIRALAAYDQAEIADQLIDRYHELAPPARSDAVSTLVARPDWAHALLGAIEAEQVPRQDLHAYHVRQLMQLRDESLQQRVRQVWGRVTEATADSRKKIEQLKSQLTPEQLASADLPHGRAVFAKTCATCHRLFGEGDQVGPDITGSNRANLDYILENLVAPSAIVGKDYQLAVLVLTDGRVLQGLVLRENDSAVTLRTVNDELVIARSEIDERVTSPLSLMPEGQLDTLTGEEVRDLIAYLASPRQVPLPEDH